MILTTLLLVFLAGFGMKAGLFPMHVWLPEAHPAAPSHVSALMSGVMIKTGVYGVLRTAMYLPAGETLATAGVILLGAGIVTGLWGVLLAAMQNDIKRLLAYSSIENVGIIFIAIGQLMTKKLTDRAGGPGSMMFGARKSNAKIYVQSTQGIHFSDVAGEDEAKENLQEIVNYLHDPGKYQELPLIHI